MNEPAGKSKRGCFFYGCLTLLILSVVGGLTAYFGVRYAFGAFVNRYTEAKRLDLPKPNMQDEDWNRVQSRITRFNRAVESGTDGEELVLTSDEINEAIQRIPDLVFFRDACAFTLEGDEIKARISYPLDNFGMSGRFLNGAAVMKLSLQDGILDARLESIQIHGTPLPDNILSKIRQENLAKDAYKDPKNAQKIRKLEKIEIKNGRLVLKPRTTQPAEVPQPVEK